MPSQQISRKNGEEARGSAWVYIQVEGEAQRVSRRGMQY